MARPKTISDADLLDLIRRHGPLTIRILSSLSGITTHQYLRQRLSKMKGWERDAETRLIHAVE